MIAFEGFVEMGGGSSVNIGVRESELWYGDRDEGEKGIVESRV